MNQIEERLAALEASRTRFRCLCLLALLLLPLAGLMAGAGLQKGLSNEREAVSSRLVTRSMVVVDEQNRPRIDLGYDEGIGPHVFLRDERGLPMLALTAPRTSGVVTILDSQGRSVAMLSRSGSGDGLVTLSDSSGRTIARVGRWAGQTEPGIEFYPVEPDIKE